AVLAVTTQHMCGMGGDLVAVVHPGRGRGTPSALLAVGRAGSGADPAALLAEGHRMVPFRGDVRAVTVPGCVDGWLALHGRFGRLPRADVLEPARAYASDGFPLGAEVASHLPSIEGTAAAADFGPPDQRRVGGPVTRPGTAR